MAKKGFYPVRFRALAAGYKAQFTCSATFNGHRSPAQIRSQELSNISNDLAPLLNLAGEARIDADYRGNRFDRPAFLARVRQAMVMEYAATAAVLPPG